MMGKAKSCIGIKLYVDAKFYYQSQDYKKVYQYEKSKNRVLYDFIYEKNSITLLKSGLKKEATENKIWITFFKSYPHFILQQQFNF